MILASSCANSLLVSPAVHNLGQVERGSVQLSAAGALLPETVPDLANQNVAAGFEARAGYQFSDAVRVEGRYFGGFATTTGGTYAHGFGGLSTITLSEAEHLHWILVAQAQFMINGGDFEGFGLAPEFGVRFDASDVISLHGVIGPTFGVRDIEDQYFVGGILNAGVSYQIVPRFYIGLDVAALYGYDAYSALDRGAMSPSLQLTYTIPTR